MSGKVSPTKELFMATTLRELQRKHAKLVTKKKPFTTEMLRAIVDKAERTKSLSDLRLATACLLLF